MNHTKPERETSRRRRSSYSDSSQPRNARNARNGSENGERNGKKRPERRRRKEPFWWGWKRSKEGERDIYSGNGVKTKSLEVRRTEEPAPKFIRFVSANFRAHHLEFDTNIRQIGDCRSKDGSKRV